MPEIKSVTTHFASKNYEKRVFWIFGETGRGRVLTGILPAGAPWAPVVADTHIWTCPTPVTLYFALAEMPVP